MAKFELNDEQVERIRAWAAEQDKVVVERQRAELETAGRSGDPFRVALAEQGLPYYGAIGGELTYSFTPTGLGVVEVVTHGGTKEKLDVTDYDCW